MPVEVPLGDETITVDLPDCEVTVAEPPGADPVDVQEAAETALANPHGPSLGALSSPDDLVTVVVPDVTRATPDEILLDALVADLERVGIAREQVTVILGLGLHRPMTDDEIGSALGTHADLAINHDPEATVQVGSVDGIPVEVHERVADADLVLSTGMVEPHQYAGFSGGAKTVVIGAGGEPLIRDTHGPDLLGEPGVRLGRIDDNPFRNLLDRAGDLAGPDFCLNVTHGPQGILGVSAGKPRAVVRDLAETAIDALSVEVSDMGGEDGRGEDGDEDGDKNGYDAVIAGVGAPKDANLYQATRAATYVILGTHNPLRDGGRVVVPAALPEGAGDGTGEQRFHEWLSTATDAEALYEEMRTGYEPGAQRAFVVARALRTHDVWITNSAHPEIVEDCLMDADDDVADAVDPGSDVLVVPDALNTLLT